MVMEIPATKKYPGNANFVVYTPDGGSFAYYPSGRMAASYTRMAGGFFCFFYSDDRDGTTLLSIDPSGCGYAAFSNGKPRLTSRKTGGVLVDESGAIIRSWTQAKQLSSEISFDLSPNIHLSFSSRQLIHAKLTVQGLTEEYDLGEVQKMATDSYISKSIGVVRMGPERGKQILDVDKCRQAAAEARERRAASSAEEVDPPKKSHITQDDMQKHPQLRDVVGSTEELQKSVKEGAWDVEVFVSKAKLQTTLSGDFPTLLLGETLKGDPYSQKLDSMPALQPDVLSSLLKESTINAGALPLSSSIKAASGRFRGVEHGYHYKTPRKRLQLLKDRSYDKFIKDDAPAGTLVVVCCLAGWLPQCRRVEPAIELLNGELYAKAQAQAGEGGVPTPEFLLCKFEMSESRLLRDRHNITTLPMYLMYYGGKLCYASNTLKGFGSSMDDMRTQARDTLVAAQRGAFLPDDFRFGHTSNNLTEDFGSTLNGTSKVLATKPY